MTEINRNRLYLVGYRCTGKTEVGRLLAAQLEWAFCDTDQMIKDYTGSSIDTIFEDEGESTFRDLEEQMLTKCTSLPETVISTGGGIIEREENRDRLKDTGYVVWLKANPDTIRNRMASDEKQQEDRPALTGTSAEEEVEEVLAERDPLYEEVADQHCSTDEQGPAEVTDRILDILR